MDTVFTITLLVSLLAIIGGVLYPGNYTAAAPKEIYGLVTKIHDGDTITVTDKHGAKHRIRLGEIDTPELKQPYGDQAKMKMVSLVNNTNVRVAVSGIDFYGRKTGRVYVGDTDVNAEMVRAGLAWWYSQYSKDQALAELQETAKQAKLGLWRSGTSISPWQWRKEKRR